MSNASEFAESLAAMGLQVEADAVALKREVALDLLRGCVLGTPVGQPRLWKSKPPKGYVGGHHRGSWQMTSGAPAETEVALRPPSAVLAEAEGVEHALERTTWITNTGPAINRLEYEGHSQQAPDGWVRAEVERVKARHP